MYAVLHYDTPLRSEENLSWAVRGECNVEKWRPPLAVFDPCLLRSWVGHWENRTAG